MRQTHLVVLPLLHHGDVHYLHSAFTPNGDRVTPFRLLLTWCNFYDNDDDDDDAHAIVEKCKPLSVAGVARLLLPNWLYIYTYNLHDHAVCGPNVLLTQPWVVYLYPLGCRCAMLTWYREPSTHDLPTMP